MTSQTILWTGMKSPARASFMKRPSTPRSILKRPAPLPLSPGPFPFAASFSVQMSPIAQSPHVHFPPSPSLFAMFSTHSPNTYDRAPIIVSPNPLSLPSWGDRVYSPSVQDFKLAVPPRHVPLTKYMSPTITEFEDPRSPKLNLASQRAARLVSFAAQPPARLSSQQSLGKALSSYPRSPYPSAPISSTQADTEDERGRSAERGWPENRERGDMIKGLPARARARARSVEEMESKKRKNTPASLAPPPRPSFPVAFKAIPSPLAQSFSTQAVGVMAHAKRPAPLDLEPASSTLSQAFWQSVLLEPSSSIAASPAFPESVEADSAESMMSPRPAQLMFGDMDGSLWSPRGPKKAVAMPESILSPAQKVAFGRFTHSMVASPSPNDPLAAFPSFSLSLSKGTTMGGPITLPPRAALARPSRRA